MISLSTQHDVELDDHYRSKLEVKTLRILIESIAHIDLLRERERENNLMFIKIIMMYQHIELLMIYSKLVMIFFTERKEIEECINRICLFFNVSLQFFCLSTIKQSYINIHQY